MKTFSPTVWSILKRATLLAFVLLLLPGCVNRLFYHPNRIAYRAPESFGAPVREVYFESSDGTKLHGWFATATTTNVLGTVVHFHGNAQNLTAHSTFVEWLPANGFHVFMFDYRGYGKSEGHPSRRGLFEDGVAALRYVRTLPEVDTNRIVVLGQSLGGATALAVAGRHPDLAGQAMVIDSAFYSYRRIVRDKIALIPILSLLRVPLSYLLITDAYTPSATLGAIAPTPILYIHGTRDLVIPFHHGEWFRDNTPGPSDLLVIENGQHISAFHTQSADAIPLVLSFITNALDGAIAVPIPE
jgi:fermentation-respiration switch protein FrsA (DUF1100 family)